MGHKSAKCTVILQSLLPTTFPPSLGSNTPLKYQLFTPNRPPVLTEQLTEDNVMNQHAWDDITTKLNEMAEENRLIKQAVCKTYNTTKSVHGKLKNKILATSPNDRINNCKQPIQGSKNVRFRPRDQNTKH